MLMLMLMLMMLVVVLLVVVAAIAAIRIVSVALVGCWLLVVGYWLLVVGCWLLVAGCWLLVVGCWWLVREVGRKGCSLRRLHRRHGASYGGLSPTTLLTHAQGRSQGGFLVPQGRQHHCVLRLLHRRRRRDAHRRPRHREGRAGGPHQPRDWPPCPGR